MDKLWQLENVTKAGLHKPRLRNLSLDIHAGITAIMGNSAAGKTSLLNLLSGFEKPDQGSVAFSPDPHRKIPFYWVPQNEGLWAHLNVEQHLEMVMPEVNANLIDRLLQDFDIANVKSALPDELSQGERARLAVARALATHARVLIMDEPLVHVDLFRRRKYWQRIKTYLAEKTASLIYASHQPSEVLGLAERIVYLKGGQLLYEGLVETLYHQPPDEETAWCLGEINWFDEAEAHVWLQQGSYDPQGYRPERLRIQPNPTSPITVEAFSFHGSIAEVGLRHTANGQTRTFYYRPSTKELKPGLCVQVDVLTQETPEGQACISPGTQKRSGD